WPKFSSTASCLRRPQASKMARSARSRLSFNRSPSGAGHNLCDCSAVSQLPSLTPIFLTPLHSSNAGSQIRAKEPRIGGLVRQAALGAPAKIDCPWSEAARFEVNPITQDNRSTEREPGLRAIPLHDFIACRYPRCASAEVKLFRTADFARSKSGNRSTALGLGQVRFDIGL